MSMQFRELAAQVAADGAISADEVLALRKVAWPDGAIDTIEAEALFAINDKIGDKIGAQSMEWADFFVEAIVAYVVQQGRVRGYVEEPLADWLIARIDTDGVFGSMAELEILVRVLESAVSTPARLKDYAIQQIERAVLTGSGPTRKGADLDPNSINAAECALLRRVIFAGGGDGPGRVSRAEAEMLFRIKDKTLGQANPPQWQTLFVQGVGNYIQGWSAGQETGVDRAAELQSFMNDNSAGLGRFFGRMAKTDADGFRNAFGSVFGRKAAKRDVAAEAREAAAVTRDEGSWLTAHIEADGQLDPLEVALKAFLADR
jgi:hypothetical protein